MSDTDDTDDTGGKVYDFQDEKRKRRRLIETMVKDLTVPVPERRWLLRDSRTGRGVIPAGRVGQFVAAGGAGKTTALVQLAVAIATGTTWLDTFAPDAPGRVLLAMAEEDDEEIRRKAQSCFGPGRIDPYEFADLINNIVRMPLIGQPSDMVSQGGMNGSMSDSEFLIELREELRVFKTWSLLIFDPASRFCGLDAEEKASRATRFVQALESLCKEFNCACVYAHHSNKVSRGKTDGKSRVSSTSGRGSSAMIDGCRWGMSMEEEDEEVAPGMVTLRCDKNSYDRRFQKMLLKHHNGILVPAGHAAESKLKEQYRPKGKTNDAMQESAHMANAKAAILKILSDGKSYGATELKDLARERAACQNRHIGTARTELTDSGAIKYDNKKYYIESSDPVGKPKDGAESF